MPQPGEVLCYKDFEFDDGTKKDKLFLVVNSSEIESSCLVLKTTSQSKRYQNVSKGCNPAKRVFFVPTSWESCFREDTYIQLPQIFEFPYSDLIKGGFERRIFVINSLSQNCFAQLKNCLKKFRKDISDRHWQMIFR